jgi:hypothetical protein
MCWTHLQVHNLSQGRPEGHCQYPIDQVLSRTGFKTTQGAVRVSARCHVSYSSGPHLPIKVDSDAATRTTTPDLTTLLWRALVMPCGPLLRTSHPRQGELRRYHMSYGTGSHLPAREGFGATTHPAVSSGPQTSSIKKGLAGLSMQLGSRVSKARSRASKTSAPEQLYPARRVDRRLQCNAGPVNHSQDTATVVRQPNRTTPYR